MQDDTALESALEFLAPFGPDLSNGMTSHAPMVVEALDALGRGDAIPAWLDGYRPLLLPRRAPSAPLRAAEWREALGRERDLAPWTALLVEELGRAPWQEVLADWTARLAPGICAAATHGVIRVAHAARSLDRGQTPLRIDELGRALGHWAATYQTLPTSASEAPASDAQGALARVARVPLAERRFTGTIVGSLGALGSHAPFAEAIDLFDSEAPIDTAISDLSEAFARAFLSNANDELTAIVFVHGVTSTVALRALAPHLDDVSTRRAIRFAWQAGAGLYAAFGTQDPLSGPIEPPRDDRDALIDRAIANGDEHAIKLVEACLAEHRRTPSPVFLAAADRGLGLLARS